MGGEGAIWIEFLIGNVFGVLLGEKWELWDYVLNCFLCDNFLSNQAESNFCDKKVNTSGSEDSSDNEDFMNLDDGLTVNSITSFD